MNPRDNRLKDGQLRVAGGAEPYIEMARDGYWEPYIEPGEVKSGAYRTYPTASAAFHAMARLRETIQIPPHE